MNEANPPAAEGQEPCGEIGSAVSQSHSTTPSSASGPVSQDSAEDIIIAQSQATTLNIYENGSSPASEFAKSDEPLSSGIQIGSSVEAEQASFVDSSPLEIDSDVPKQSQVVATNLQNVESEILPQNLVDETTQLLSPFKSQNSTALDAKFSNEGRYLPRNGPKFNEGYLGSNHNAREPNHNINQHTGGNPSEASTVPSSSFLNDFMSEADFQKFMEKLNSEHSLENMDPASLEDALPGADYNPSVGTFFGKTTFHNSNSTMESSSVQHSRGVRPDLSISDNSFFPDQTLTSPLQGITHNATPQIRVSGNSVDASPASIRVGAKGSYKTRQEAFDSDLEEKSLFLDEGKPTPKHKQTDGNSGSAPIFIKDESEPSKHKQIGGNPRSNIIWIKDESDDDDDLRLTRHQSRHYGHKKSHVGQQNIHKIFPQSKSGPARKNTMGNKNVKVCIDLTESQYKVSEIPIEKNVPVVILDDDSDSGSALSPSSKKRKAKARVKGPAKRKKTGPRARNGREWFKKNPKLHLRPNWGQDFKKSEFEKIDKEMADHSKRVKAGNAAKARKSDKYDASHVLQSAARKQERAYIQEEDRPKPSDSKKNYIEEVLGRAGDDYDIRKLVSSAKQLVKKSQTFGLNQMTRDGFRWHLENMKTSISPVLKSI